MCSMCSHATHGCACEVRKSSSGTREEAHPYIAEIVHYSRWMLLFSFET